MLLAGADCHASFDAGRIAGDYARMPEKPLSELRHWVALSRVQGIGPRRFAILESHFGSIENAWPASESDLIAGGLDARSARAVVEARKAIDPDEEWERLEREGVTAVHLRSADYPALLREIHDPPPVLYVRGELEPLDDRTVAVIGSRAATAYGKEMARRISGGLASSGVSVLSGLARGIDGIAHRAALEAGGKTVAVMGGGLDRIYPSEHTELARAIVEGGGALVTEYAMGMRPQAEHFPRRNRVISGLSRGVVVVEGDMKSGALLTVRWALDQDREVFAVPGSVLSPKSAGPNWLIQQGARLITGHEDVLEELNLAAASAGNGVDSDGKFDLEGVDILARENNQEGADGRILAVMIKADGPMHVDEITRSVGLPAPEVSSNLTLLELRGAVRQAGPMSFILDPSWAGKIRRPR
jgi:DNA processing protein